MIYNNGNGRPGPDFSTVEIILPPQDSLGFYIMPATEPFGPENPDWIYGDQPGENFYSTYLSNAQRLPNGNTLINAGSPGSIFEIDDQKNIVWDYIIPLNGDSPITQGQNAGSNSNFRAYKYTADYQGFEGKDLTPGPTLENGVSPINCEIFVGTKDPGKKPLKIETLYNPTNQILNIFESSKPSTNFFPFRYQWPKYFKSKNQFP